MHVSNDLYIEKVTIIPPAGALVLICGTGPVAPSDAATTIVNDSFCKIRATESTYSPLPKAAPRSDLLFLGAVSDIVVHIV